MSCCSGFSLYGLSGAAGCIKILGSRKLAVFLLTVRRKCLFPSAFRVQMKDIFSVLSLTHSHILLNKCLILSCYIYDSKRTALALYNAVCGFSQKMIVLNMKSSGKSIISLSFSILAFDE